MAEDPRLELVERFFRGTGNTYDLVVNAATFGIDRSWKRRLVELIPAGATRILDLACGTGISTAAIARRFPGAQIVGVELREEYLAIARRKLPNVELILSRAEDYRSAAAFDCITSSYLAKYADLARLVPQCREMLREGGVLLMHDWRCRRSAARCCRRGARSATGCRRSSSAPAGCRSCRRCSRSTASAISA